MSTEGRCAHCNEGLGSHYYQDVPNEGDLCLVCHKSWVRLTKWALAQEENREPDGEGEMPTFTVIKRQVFCQRVNVNAPSPEKAIQLVRHGAGEVIDDEYSYDLDEGQWDVEDADGVIVMEAGELV